MTKRIKWSEERIERLEAEGRGKGTGPDYKPWIHVHDFSSLGNSRRVFSRKTGRVHHFLSDVEWHFFLLLEHAGDVTDIREQFPLPRQRTLSIAAEKSIRHPIYPGTSVPAVMTCDFLVTRTRGGQKTLSAFSCKRSDGPIDLRTLEKLEIERVFFNLADIPHHLVFHSELPAEKIKNLIWCRGAAATEGGIEEYPEALQEHTTRFISELDRPTPSCSLAEYCARYDTRTGAAAGTGLRIARALLWQGDLVTDLHQPDLAGLPMAMFRRTEQRSLRLVGD